MKKLLFILIALLQLKVALAQTFPVRVTPQAIPPYPTNLSGYANSGITNSPLRVQLVLSDVTASSREVRLAVAIEGNGINAISAPVVIGAPTLILDGGIPLNLTISELAPYFEQQNLQGISAVQYNSPLPDGSYRFCFEVFDAFTGNRLSSKNCATIFLINNDPPFLNKPDNQAKISEQNPTNIIFQWTPRHINVPNVSYEFSLVEVWDPYIDPQAIFVASPPLYQEVTTNTSLLYGPVQPLLLPGKRYAWRVRAFATNNGEEVSVFNNNGNSEIFWFDYQASCELPSNIQVQDVSMTNATISWIGHPDHLDYTIKYREAGSDRWYSKTTPRDYVTIDEFKADTVYEYRVVGNCTQNSFGESPVNTFRTLSEELADYASCGIQPDPVDLSNQELLTELFVNDVFTAGDFPVYVKEVSGSTSFTGEGYISTPWLATVRIPVKFENIKINTEMKLVDGFVVTTYDPNWGSIADADVIIDTITGDDGDTQVINVDMDIVDVLIDENGDITLIGADGTESDTFDGGNDIIFVDNTREEWHINPDGTITKGEQAEGGPANSGNTDGVSSGGVNEITATGITVIFNNTNGFYSFDTAPKNAGGSIANEYDKVPISGGGEYDIPYKAIAALPNHLTDFVTAEVAISTNDYSASDIIFKTKEGTKVQASWNRDSTTATLSLKKAFDFAKQQIIATVRPKDSTDKYKVAGAANLWHLANQQVAGINVKLISVNGASLSGIGERINEIYNPAGIQFNVTSASPLTVSDTTLDVGDSSLLSQYTEGEKAWISQFKTLPGYQQDTYYLFVTDIPPSDSGTEGFMPLKRQFGFVFAGDDKGRTTAHELGHGVFGLEHPFKKYNTTGTTDLLMDYGTGVRLSHMDWEKMHAPGIQIYWFQGDEDGQSVRVSKLPDGYENSDETYTFMTLNGSYITLPKNVQNVTFITGLDDYKRKIKYPTGALQSFVLDSIKYTVKTTHNDSPIEYKEEDFQFTYSGFYSDDNKPFPLTNANKSYSNQVILFKPKYGAQVLSLKQLTNLPYEESGTVNILKDYTNFAQFYAQPEQKSTSYSYNEVTPFDDSYKLSEDKVGEIFGSNIQWNSAYLIISKLAALNSRYPEIIRKEMPNVLSSVPVEVSHEALKSLDNEKLISIYLQLLNKVEIGIDNCKENLTNIDESTDSNRIEECIGNLTDNELSTITTEDKLMAISILLNNWKLDNNQEIQLIRLIHHTKEENVDPLLTGLNSKSVLADVDDILLKKLIYKTDNDHTYFSEDNYKKLIYVLAELTVGKSKKFKDNLENLSSDDFVERNIKFYYKPFWDLVLGDFSAFWSFLQGESIYTYDTKVDWLSNGTTDIKIQTNIYAGAKPVGTTEPINLKAFEPIFFTNKSGLSMLSDYNKDKPVLSPAILTYYASDVGNTKTIVDGIQATVDVISISSGYGALARAPSFARKTFIIADMIGSGVSIAKSAGGQNLKPEAKAFLDALDVLTATIAITELGSNAKNLKHIFNRVKSHGTGLPRKEAVENFLDKLIASEGKIDQSFDQNKLQEARVWISNLEMEAKLGNIDDLKDKIEKAKRVLSSLPDATEDLASKISSFKNRIKSLNNGNGLPNLLNKFNQLDDISKSKFLDDFENASSWALTEIDKSSSFAFEGWKKYASEIKRRKQYTAPDDKIISDVKNSLNDPQEIKLVQKVDNVSIPFEESSFVCAGGYHPNINDGEIIIDFNLKGVERNFTPTQKYKDFLASELTSPIISEKVDFLNLIRGDKNEEGGLYKKIYDINPEKIGKIDGASQAGSHAEVRVFNEILKKMTDKGIPINDSELSKIRIFIKNKNGRNMCRCPHCYYIIGDKVKIIGNE